MQGRLQVIKMRKVGWLTALVALALAGCGGGGSSDFAGSSSSGGTSSGGTSSGGASGGGAVSASITAVTDAATIPSDGSTPANITAYVRDAQNNLLSGIPVTFTATSGGISGSPATTDAGGAASATLITAGDTTPRTITVTATAGTLQATVNVQVVASSSSTTVQMGNGTGASFVAGAIGISNPNVSAGGSTSLTVSLVQSDGNLYTGSATIGFNSNCVAAGTAEIQQNGAKVTSVTITSGIATVTYVAKGCSGADTVTASSTVSNSPLSATGTVTVAQASVGSISFISATPTNIALKGTGDATRPESSTVVFRVLDASGGAVSGAVVDFSLNTTVGGITMTPAPVAPATFSTATSDVNGNVQIVVNAGTVATSVKVTASVEGTNISTQSSQLTVTTGIATANNFSLAVGCFNVEGWDLDGTQTEVTARLADRFQNPVPDGTAVTFHSEGGKIGAQCTTTTSSSEGGVCSVNFTSQAFRPADGRVSLLAMAIGEESFTDVNGNGAFDAGDTLFDTAEAYEDDNENGAYDAGEYFYDFDNGGTLTAADLNFNGVLCNDPARCSGPKSAGIGVGNLIILSGSTPTISDTAGVALPATDALGINSAKTYTFWVRDLHGNPMPGGTTVALSTSGAGLQVAAPASFAVPCTFVAAGTHYPGITEFSYSVTTGTTLGTGVMTLTVTTPKGTVTIAQISITVS
jgi:hypothetical protein